MGKRFGWIIILAGVIIVFILIIIHANNPIDQAAERAKRSKLLRVGLQDNAISGLIIIAAQKHYFHDHGLSVGLIMYPSGKLALEGMLKNEVDIAASSDIPILIHSTTDPNLALIATIAEGDSHDQVVVRKGEGIDVPQDLVGRRIATQKNSGVDYYTWLFLKHYNIPFSSVIMVYMPAEKLVMALRSGYVDAFVMRSPYTNLAEQVMPGNLIMFQVPNLYQYHFNLVVPRSEINPHKTELHRFLYALYDAQQYINQHPEDSKNILIKFFGLGRRDEINQVWPGMVYRLTLDKNLPDSMKKQEAWAISTGRLKASKLPDINKLIDPSLLNSLLNEVKNK